MKVGVWEPGAPGEHSRAGKGPGSQQGAPPGEGWAAGALPALKGTCRGVADFAAALLGRQVLSEKFRGVVFMGQERSASLIPIK